MYAIVCYNVCVHLPVMIRDVKLSQWKHHYFVSSCFLYAIHK